jgi:hypothetical protein
MGRGVRAGKCVLNTVDNFLRKSHNGKGSSNGGLRCWPMERSRECLTEAVMGGGCCSDGKEGFITSRSFTQLSKTPS